MKISRTKPLSRSRLKISRRIQDFVMVTLFTALILIFAEQRTLVTHGPTVVRIQVQLESGNQVVVAGAEQGVEVSFEGAQNQIAELKERLRNASSVVVQPTVEEAGPQNAVLGDLLEDSELLQDLYVNITRLNPASIDFEVDTLDEITATINFDPEGVKLLDGSRKIDPVQIQITGPITTLERLENYPENIEFRLEPVDDIQSLEPGVEHRRDLRVSMPEVLVGAKHVALEPDIIEVTFIIDKLNTSATRTLPSVPVKIIALPNDQRSYSVLIHEDDRVISKVDVTGPPELLDQLAENPLFAYINLSSDDLARAANSGEEQTAQANPLIPIEGIEVQLPTTAIRYTVTRQP
ncbi:MAG: YbbR-like domain-containing protein [Planctomycetota bacterium]|jgi:hypothetical protein